MSNIRVDLGYTIHDGTEIKFRSPSDCSAITGLIVYYPGSDGNIISKVFAFADAHGNNVGNIDNLFAKNVVVKVILDVTKGMAFVQNADTNAYLEDRFDQKVDREHGEAYWFNVKDALTLMQSDESNGVYFSPGSPGDSIVLEMLGTYQDEPVILRGLGQPEDGNDAVQLNYANEHYAPISHVSNKSNPHGVTAAQVGARPNTWNPAFLTDKGNSGYRGGLQYSGSSTGVPKYVAVWDIDDAAGVNEPNRVVRAAQADIVRDLIGAAPSGYGYGGQAIALGYLTTEAALTTALASVYDAMDNQETKLITYSGYPSKSDWRWFGILDRSSANNGSFVAHSVYSGGSKVIKQKYNGIWQDCEWENPPMIAGEEYRTIHRYKGEPVYCKLIVQKYNTTIGAATGYSDYNIAHGIDGITRLLKVDANMDDTILLPYVAGAGGHTFILQDVDQTYIKLRVYCDTWTNPTVALIAYYTR